MEMESTRLTRPCLFDKMTRRDSTPEQGAAVHVLNPSASVTFRSCVFASNLVRSNFSVRPPRTHTPSAHHW
jgi:hypothetical protein